MRHSLRGLTTLLAALALIASTACDGDKGGGEGGKGETSDGNKESGDKPEANEGDKEPKSPENVPKELKNKDVRNKATLVMPSPDQFLTVMSVLGDPKFEGLVEEIKDVKFDSKTQTAIVSGIVLAHFFVHVHAKDAKAADKALDDVLTMAKALKIKTPDKEVKKVRKRLKKEEWAQLRGDFLDMNSEIQKDLIETQKKPDLAILISLGAYLEGAHIGAQLIHDDYSKERAELLRQSELIKEIRRSTKDSLDKDDKYVGLMLDNLGKLQKLMDIDPDDNVSKDKAKEIQDLAAKTKKKLLET